MDEILVECPRCGACAGICARPTSESPTHSLFTPRRVTCAECGFIKEWEGNAWGFDWFADPVRDSYFNLPLWLQAPCCGHILWAYNRRHLSLIEQYIAALLREHRRRPDFGWHNNSLVNRLPEWIIVAKHRQAVLDTIHKMQAV
jgi:hypothetical protein